MNRITVSYQEKVRMLTFTAISCIDKLSKYNSLSSGAADKEVRAPNYLEGPGEASRRNSSLNRILLEGEVYKALVVCKVQLK